MKLTSSKGTGALSLLGAPVSHEIYLQFLGKEVKTMKYSQPELVVITAVTAAVQSTSKDGSNHFDLSMAWSNPPAYEADE